MLLALTTVSCQPQSGAGCVTQ